MIRQPHAAQRELIVADAIRELASELRLVDCADYVVFIRLEQFAALSDIIESAAELYFMPGTLRLGPGSRANFGWNELPRVILDLELHLPGVAVYLALILEAQSASVELNFVSFDDPDDDPDHDTIRLAAALAGARIRRTEAASER